MAEPTLAEPITTLGQIAGGVVFGLGLLSTGLIALWQYVAQRKEKAKPEYAVLEAAEIADMAPARELVRTLGPKMEKVFRIVDQTVEISEARFELQKDMMRQLQEEARKIDLIVDMLRQATEERRIASARQDERDKWDRRGPAE